MRRHIAFACALLLTTGSAAPITAQGTKPASASQLDRKKPPVPGKIPELRVPKWTTGKLSNGALLIVSERHDLPLVSFSFAFLGGT
jgi:zinc protease